MSEQKQTLTKKTLMQLYYEEEKTMQDIGDIHNITRERVRQLMEKFGLPRIRGRFKHPHGLYYKDIESYFNTRRKRKGDTAVLRRFLDKISCSECGSTKFLDIHHINYPAKALNDIQVLCRSCHKLKHNKGMTYEKQLLLYNLHNGGITHKQLASEFGISKVLVGKIIHKIKNGYHTLRG